MMRGIRDFGNLEVVTVVVEEKGDVIREDEDDDPVDDEERGLVAANKSNEIDFCRMICKTLT